MRPRRVERGVHLEGASHQLDHHRVLTQIARSRTPRSRVQQAPSKVTQRCHGGPNANALGQPWQARVCSACERRSAGMMCLRSCATGRCAQQQAGDLQGTSRMPASTMQPHSAQRIRMSESVLVDRQRRARRPTLSQWSATAAAGSVTSHDGRAPVSRRDQDLSDLYRLVDATRWRCPLQATLG
jgi:hypothetical protein